MRRKIKAHVGFYRISTSPLRLMPDFLIIGAQRCGTTSLYRYLSKHAYVTPALRKEIHFFDINYRKGMAWYRAHFPSLWTKIVRKSRKSCFITGEASPYYIFHPHAPKRIARVIPSVKLIVLLRNPVDRAYSHYHHALRQGNETLSFEDAIGNEEERLCREMEKMLEDENYYSFNHQKYSYLSRGIYSEQIETWLTLFPREQILIEKSEDLYTNPQMILNRVLDFLSLPAWEMDEDIKYNTGSYGPIDPNTRERLIDFYRQHNARLYQLLGIEFDWDS